MTEEHANKLKLTVPEAQRQQLQAAIVSLIAVALGIVLTLAGQLVSQGLGIAEPALPIAEPQPVVSTGAVYDPIEAMGTTHLTDLSLSGDLTVGDDTTFTDDVAVTGDLAVGNGTPSVTQNGEDAYVEGQLEVDGEAQFDGAIDANGAADIAGALTLALNTTHFGALSVASESFTYTAATGVTGTVATIPDGQIWLVHAVLVNVTANFNATGDDATLVVGDGNDADGFIVLADAELQAADTEGTGFTAGWQGMTAATLGAYLDANHNAFVYAPSGADETIDYELGEGSGETLAAGAATIYVLYTRIQ